MKLCKNCTKLIADDACFYCKLYKKELETSKLYEPMQCEKCKGRIKPKKIPQGKKNKILDAEWASQVKQRDNYTCQLCGSKENLNAHHCIHTKAHGNLTRWLVENGITLCYSCHIHKIHSGSLYWADILKDIVIRKIGKEKYDEIKNINKVKK